MLHGSGPHAGLEVVTLFDSDLLKLPWAAVETLSPVRRAIDAIVAGLRPTARLALEAALVKAVRREGAAGVRGGKRARASN